MLHAVRGENRYGVVEGDACSLVVFVFACVCEEQQQQESDKFIKSKTRGMFIA